MMPHEHNNTNARPATLGANFTTEEAARLMSLRRNFHAQTEYLERVVDERRMQFARWLLDHGKLTEACADDYDG